MLALAREMRREPTESERILWRGLRNRALGVKFRRQQPIGAFVVDFFCPDRGLIVEVDGPIHAEQVEYDRERQELLEACGYRMVRVSAESVVRELARVLKQITQALALPPSPLDGEGGQGGEVP
jgi:very-short-patch-repair endonuclease